MMPSERFEFGNLVRHSRRPEWGIGSVVRTEDVTIDGKRTQRVSVRFPGEGLKTLLTSRAELQRDDAVPEAGDDSAEASPMAAWAKVREWEWLAPMADRKIEEAMINLPVEIRDPFSSLRKRLTFALGLYRFDRSGRGLIDWAVAQTGLRDPLSRFNRHELEQFFDRWVFERDAHLVRLLQEAADEQDLIDELLVVAPPAAREAVRRLSAVR